MTTPLWSALIRPRFSVPALAALVALLAGVTAEAPATAPAYVVAIQEDWSLTINTPNATDSSPQLATQMAPSNSAGTFFLLNMNSTLVGTSTYGGLNLEAWSGSTKLGSSPASSTSTLGTNNELITWTQCLARGPSNLTFGVLAASSQTWGNFSVSWSSLSATPSSSSDLVLDNYDVTYSVDHSGITFGANRVNTLTLTGYRKYYSDLTHTSDTTARVVYQTPGN